MESAYQKRQNTVRVMGKFFWSFCEKYGINQKEQATLLGIKENRTRLNKFKEEGLIPDDPDKMLRVSHLMGIHKSLRILFPHNREVVYSWFKTPRKQFSDKSALEYIAEGEAVSSMMRLATVRRFLDTVRVSA